MDHEEATALINKAGGDVAFARLLGLDSKKHYLQRVNNWKRRGIPAAVVLEHYHAIQILKQKVGADSHGARA